ncbi:response regulator transcription factor [Actinokineospora fastidiosa]|uniref:DNA-binding response regulator n=1 Tax=Actinokineospora fastidiosa TaxID=1816 RepID=A0A918LJ41_9PSEU|nr:response regulator transcription factor [Actinokineospora fastidiosa]GGS54214.1 DNA-binding response regulator [Actinokineospora fastidiosa]
MAEVLLIEDDPSICRGLELALGRHGHRVRIARTGEEGLCRSRSVPPDVVVLDLMLPGVDGFEVCRRLRAEGDVPVIMLTARGNDFDIVGGLEAGADDYVVKPVMPRVLDARIRAVLRRGRTGAGAARVDRHGTLTIDRASLTVARRGVEVSLTPTELRLLLVLSASPGQVFSRVQLLEAVWEHDYLGDSRLVDNCVQRLRAKIEDDSARPVFVQTVRGFGYRFGPT